MKKNLRIIVLALFLVLNSVGSFGSFGVKTKEKEPETTANPNLVKTTPTVDAATIAKDELKSLSRKEKKDRFKEFKNAIKEYKVAKKAGQDVNTNTLILVLLAILIPPLAVYLHEGTTNNVFWLNVILTVLGFVLFGFLGSVFLGSLPGIVHALIVVLGA